MTQRMFTAGSNDAELVAGSLAGQRDAFRAIVERYQSLICSQAYCATGSLSQSEDLAQETFVIAWRQLAELREPAKLRSWLCGIARNRIGKALRRDGREPAHVAEPIEAAVEVPAPEPQPADHAISHEEEAILWRSLERIPDTYREPLVLFYREHQSIERVAEQLELSADTVKQRLFRGRKLLHEQVLAFVEGALERTNPGKAFTLSVVAALPVFATSASAATVGAGAVKGSTLAKAAATAGLAGAILGPIIGLLGGWLGTKMSIENTQSPRERQFMVRVAKWTWALAGSFCVAIWAFVLAANSWWKTHPVLITVLFVGSAVGYAVILILLILWANRTQRRIQREEAAKLPPSQFAKPRFASQPVEYRSRWTLLGLPLVHIQFENKPGDKTLAAKGWIAIGNKAYGGLFAAGGLAVAPISMGGFAVGLVAMGGGAMGLLSCAGLALGGWAVGGGAAGYDAFAGGALGWRAAMGGMAVAREFAVGGAAFAQHANDAIARAFMQNSLFFPHAEAFMRHASLLIWLPMLLVVWQAMRVRRRLQAQASAKQGLPPDRACLWTGLILSALLAQGCKPAPATSSALNTMTLPNGIQVVSVPFPGSTNVSIFTFLPLGLTTDGPDQAQWSHLVEHLVIRSTVPTESPQANAETLPDHMRLDFYGNTGNWLEGLSHHRRWLEGVAFTEASLATEKPKVTAECDFTARNLATHKFAVASWSQGCRFGQTNIALKGDVTRARLADVQRLRDERLAVSNHVTVCVVGGSAAEQVFAEVQRQLGEVRLTGTLPTRSDKAPRNPDLTWDLDARHLLLIWPIPDFQQPDHAALIVAAQCLNMQLAADPQLTKQTGMVFAGADLTTPEGSFFFVSASVRPQADLNNLREALLAHLGRLASNNRAIAQASLIGHQLSASMTTVPDIQALQSQTPPGMTPAMIEGNVGLQLGMHMYRYGDQRTALARQLAEVTSANVQKAAGDYLSSGNCLECVLKKANDPSG